MGWEQNNGINTPVCILAAPGFAVWPRNRAPARDEEPDSRWRRRERSCPDVRWGFSDFCSQIAKCMISFVAIFYVATKLSFLPLTVKRSNDLAACAWISTVFCCFKCINVMVGPWVCVCECAGLNARHSCLCCMLSTGHVCASCVICSSRLQCFIHGSQIYLHTVTFAT